MTELTQLNDENDSGRFTISSFRRRLFNQLLLGTALAMLVFLMSLTGCGAGDADGQGPLDKREAERVVAELEGRSFRQFDPSQDANPRKGIVLSFFGGISLWAQYAKDDRAVNEWEIRAKDYRVEGSGDESEVAIYFNEPRTMQELPTKCDGCIEISGFSISIRNVFDDGKMRFKLNDPDGLLPPPFPVFESWTKFREDEIIQ